MDQANPTVTEQTPKTKRVKQTDLLRAVLDEIETAAYTGISISSLRLFELGKLGSHEAVTAIAIAYIANLTFKLGLAAVVGGALLARRCAHGALALAVGVAGALLLL